jgi:hypothetical protein
VILRITHHHAVRGVHSPLEFALHTSDTDTHSYFGDHPDTFDDLAHALRDRLTEWFPQAYTITEEKTDARPVSHRRKPSRTPDQR